MSDITEHPKVLAIGCVVMLIAVALCIYLHCRSVREVNQTEDEEATYSEDTDTECEQDPDEDPFHLDEPLDLDWDLADHDSGPFDRLPVPSRDIRTVTVPRTETGTGHGKASQTHEYQHPSVPVALERQGPVFGYDCLALGQDITFGLDALSDLPKDHSTILPLSTSSPFAQAQGREGPPPRYSPSRTIDASSLTRLRTNTPVSRSGELMIFEVEPGEWIDVGEAKNASPSTLIGLVASTSRQGDDEWDIADFITPSGVQPEEQYPIRLVFTKSCWASGTTTACNRYSRNEGALRSVYE